MSNSSPSTGSAAGTAARIPPVSSPTWRPDPALVLFVSLISVGIGQTLIFAVLPPIARELGLSEIQVGSIFTVSAVLWMLMSPFWGRRSDVWGRRPMILLGLGGYAASMAGFGICLQLSLSGWLALTPSFIALISARAIFGLFGSAAIPGAQAYIADHTPAHKRGSQLALLSAAFATGTIIGPGVVAALLGLGFSAPFYGGALLGLLGLVTVGTLLPPEQRTMAQQHESPTEIRLSPLDGRALPFLLIAVGLELVLTIGMLAASFYAIDVLGMSSAESAQAVGMMFMGSAIAVLLTQLVFIRLLEPSPRVMLGLGSFIITLGFSGIVASSTYAMMFPAVVLLGFGFGLLRPGVMAGSSLSVSKEEQGSVAGLMNATGGVGVVLAPFVGMSLYQFIPQAPYLLCIALSVMMLLAVVLVPRVRASDGRALA